MLVAPSFEHTILVTDDALLAARISSLFRRPRYYFPVMDGPRMTRSDAGNEVIRRRNAMAMARPRRVLLGGIPPQACAAMRGGWKNCTVADDYEDHAQALRQVVTRPKNVLRWGPDNLGVGLYLARLENKELLPDLESSPSLDLVKAGAHLLVACERGDNLAEVLASNLAFACGASFAVIPELPEEDREAWLDDIYALGEGGDVTGRFIFLAKRARGYLGELDFSSFKTVLFVTGGFPWGMAVPEVPTTHMYRYPDLGRSIVEGMWVSQSAARSARTALLVDPQKVDGSEIPAINKALLKNGTLTRVVRGPAATSTRVQLLLDLLPHDIIVLSSHSGEVPGKRITYEFDDADGRKRRLTVDRALGIGYDRHDDRFMLTEYHRFHSLDGVDWRDKAAKAALPVGSAITSWSGMDGPIDRKDCIVEEERIDRVIGSMGIQLHDGILLYASHGFAPGASPLIINNSCWSWHELSQRATFAGARGYVGSLFPITDAEAQEVGQALFGRYIGKELHRALWSAQSNIYGQSVRRPYVMVGLPFVTICLNTSDSESFLSTAYIDGIAYWSGQATRSACEEIRRNAQRFSRFLAEDLQAFRRGLEVSRRSHR